ncbi:MFS transporter [Streptomyces goshikiensis]
MVVLDATIVNIALPHIQTALSFSTTDLSWVLSAYTLTFGGLLLLGGRAGDILGRRRVFMTGILLFTLASLLGGFAREPWQLLAARALQGVGGAIASPTSLAPDHHHLRRRARAEPGLRGVRRGLRGRRRDRPADGRHADRVARLALGPLRQRADRRTDRGPRPLYISESERHPGHFDIAGALTSTGGMASLVYGFIRASEDGWRDPLTIGSFAAALVLLGLFVAVEARAQEPIIPLRMFADRNRAGTYLIMLGLAAAMFGMFFFIVQFIQNVLGFSPIRSGLGFLPVTAAIITAAGLSQRFLPRFGPKPFMVTGAALTGAGLTWLTFITTGSSYLSGVLGPMLLFGFGMGLNFVTLTLTAVSGVAPQEAGAASGLLNASQQVGGSLGLSILVTVFGSASRHEAERQVPAFMAQADPGQLAAFKETGRLPDPWGDHVLTQGISTAFIAAVAMAGLALATAVLMIRVRKSDLDALGGVAAKAGPAA